MARIFISYSRDDEAFARRLAADLDRLGADIWIDVDDIPPGMKWSTAIQQGLDSCDVMIVILSPDSMASINVEDEWQYFMDRGRPVIPVLWRRTRVHFQLHRLQYIDFLTQPYAVAFGQLYGHLRDEGIPLGPLTASGDSAPLPREGQALPARDRRYGRAALIMGTVGAIVIGAAAVGWLGGVLGDGNGNDTSGFLDPDALASTVVALNSTQTAQARTSTPVNALVEVAANFSGTNRDWIPVIEEFDGVEMVLVPAGCFQMGSDAPGAESDEQPVHEVCFEQPFWIDRTEVTNAQYGFEGYFSGDDRPREDVTWDAAQAHCAGRGARLPTEAEWEYAARGPDALIYPWGIEFVADNVVYRANAGDQTAEVGSKPGGASWVGALDMSGNVWEWLADWYVADYYSTLTPGVVNPTGPETGDGRVLHGGSWSDEPEALYAANRDGIGPLERLNFVGFRCARDVD